MSKRGGPSRVSAGPALAESVDRFRKAAEDVENAIQSGQLNSPLTGSVAMRRNSIAATSPPAVQRRASVAAGAGLRPRSMSASGGGGGAVGRSASVSRRASVSISGSAIGSRKGSGIEATLPTLPETFVEYDPQTVRRPTALNPKKLNSLQLAAYNGDTNKIRSLMMEKKRDLDKLDTVHGVTALQIAAEKGDQKICNALIDGVPMGNGEKKRCTVDVQNSDGRTALHLAAMMMKPDIVILLLTHRASPDIQDTLGCVPLHYTLLNNDRTSFFALCRAGAKLQVTDKTGNTILHHATRLGNVELTKHLLEQGADVDSKNAELRTPLHIAVSCGSEEMIRLLLQYGADPTISDFMGMKAIDLVDPDDTEIMNLLILKERAKEAKEVMVKKDFQSGDENEDEPRRERVEEETTEEAVELLSSEDGNAKADQAYGPRQMVSDDEKTRRTIEEPGEVPKSPERRPQSDLRSELHDDADSIDLDTEMLEAFGEDDSLGISDFEDDGQSGDKTPQSPSVASKKEKGQKKNAADELDEFEQFLLGEASNSDQLKSADKVSSQPSVKNRGASGDRMEQSHKRSSRSALKSGTAVSEPGKLTEKPVRKSSLKSAASLKSGGAEEDQPCSPNSNRETSPTRGATSLGDNPEAPVNRSRRSSLSRSVHASMFPTMQPNEMHDDKEERGRRSSLPRSGRGSQPGSRHGSLPRMVKIGDHKSSSGENIERRPPPMSVRINSPESPMRKGKICKLDPGEMTATANKLLVDLKMIEQKFAGQDEISSVVHVLANYVRETNEIALAADEEHESYRLLWKTVRSDVEDPPQQLVPDDEASPNRDEVLAWVNKFRKRRNTDATIANSPMTPAGKGTVANSPMSPAGKGLLRKPSMPGRSSALQRVETQQAQLDYEVKSLEAWLENAKQKPEEEDVISYESPEETEERERLEKEAADLEKRRSALLMEYAGLSGQYARTAVNDPAMLISRSIPAENASPSATVLAGKVIDTNWQSLARQLAAEKLITLQLSEDLDALKFDHEHLAFSKKTLENRLDQLQEKFVKFNEELDSLLSGIDEDREDKEKAEHTAMLNLLDAEELRSEAMRERGNAKKYKDDLGILTTKLRIIETSYQELDFRVNALLEEKKILQDARNAVNQSKITLQAALEKLLLDNEDLMSQLKTADEARIAGRDLGTTLQNSIEKLQQENQLLTCQISELRRLGSSSGEQLSSSRVIEQSSDQSVIAKLKADLVAMTRKLALSERERNKLAVAAKGKSQADDEAVVANMRMDLDDVTSKLAAAELAAQKRSVSGQKEDNATVLELKKELDTLTKKLVQTELEAEERADGGFEQGQTEVEAEAYFEAVKAQGEAAVAEVQKERDIVKDQLVEAEAELQRKVERGAAPGQTLSAYEEVLAKDQAVLERLKDEVELLEEKLAQTELDAERKLEPDEDVDALADLGHMNRVESTVRKRTPSQRRADDLVLIGSLKAQLTTVAKRLELSELERKSLSGDSKQEEIAPERLIIETMRTELDNVTKKLEVAESQRQLLQKRVHDYELDQIHQEAVNEEMKSLLDGMHADQAAMKTSKDELQAVSKSLASARAEKERLQSRVKEMESQLRRVGKPETTRNLKTAELENFNLEAENDEDIKFGSPPGSSVMLLNTSIGDLNSQLDMQKAQLQEVQSRLEEGEQTWKEREASFLRERDESFEAHHQLSQEFSAAIASFQKVSSEREHLTGELQEMQATLESVQMDLGEARLKGSREIEERYLQERVESAREAQLLTDEVKSVAAVLAAETKLREQYGEELEQLKLAYESLQMDFGEAQYREKHQTHEKDGALSQELDKMTSRLNDQDAAMRQERDENHLEIQALTESLNAVTLKLRETTEEREQLLERQLQLTDEIESLQMDLGEAHYNAKLQSRNKENELIQQLDEMTAMLHDKEAVMRQEREESCQEIQSLTKTLNAVELQLREQTQQREQLLERQEKLQAEFESVQMDLGSERFEKDKVTQRCTHLENTIDTLNAEVESNRASITTLTNECEELRNTLQELTSKAREEGSANQDLVKYYDTEMQLLTTQIEVEKELRRARDDEHVRISQTVSELEDNLAHVEQTYEGEVKRAKEVEKELSTQLTQMRERVGVLDASNKQLESGKTMQTQRIEVLERDLQALATKAKQLEDERAKQKQLIEELENAVQSAETKAKQLERKHVALTAEHETLRAEHDQRAQSHQENAGELQGRLKEALVKREKTEADLFSSIDELSELRTKIQRYETRATRSAAEIKEHLQQIETLENTLATERSALGKIEASYKTAQLETGKLREELAQMKEASEKQEAELRQVRTAAATFEGRANAAETEINELRLSKSEKQKIEVDLAQVRETQTEVERRAQMTESALADSREQLQTITREKELLAEDLSKTREELSKFRQRAEIADNKMTKSMSELEELKLELHEIQLEKQNLTTSLAGVTEKASSLEIKIRETENERKILEVQMSQVALRNEDLLTNMKKLNEVAVAAEEKAHTLELETERLQVQLHNVTIEKEKLDVTCKGLRETATQTQVQIAALREDNGRMNARVEKDLLENQRMTGEMQRLSEEKLALEQKLNALQLKFETLQAQHRQTTSDKNSAQSDLSELRETIGKLEERIHNAQQEIEGRKKEHQRLSTIMNTAKDENTEQAQLIATLQLETARLERALEVSRLSNGESRGTLEKKLYELERQVETVQRERDTLKDEAERIKAVLEMRISESNQHSATRSIAGLEIQSLRDQIAELQAKLESREVDIGDLQTKLKDRTAALTVKIQDREAEIEKLEEQMREQTAELSSQIQGKQTEIDEIARKSRDQVQDVNTKLQSRENEIRDLTAKLNEVERNKKEVLSMSAEMERQLKTVKDQVSETELLAKSADDLASERRQRADALTKELSRRKQDLHDLQQTLETINHDHAAEVCELRTQLLAVTRTREGLSARLSEAQDVVEKAQNALTELEHTSNRERAELERQLNAARQTASAMEADQARMTEELKLVRAALDKAHAQLGTLTSSEIQGSLDRQGLQELLSRKEALVKQIQTNFDNTRESLTASEVRVVTMETELRRMTLEIQALRTVKSQWETERANMEQEFELRATAAAAKGLELEKTQRLYKEASLKVQALEAALFEGADEQGGSGKGVRLSASSSQKGMPEATVFKTVAQLQHQLTLARERQVALERELEEERGRRQDLEAQSEATRQTLQAEIAEMATARDELTGRIVDADRYNAECENQYRQLIDTDATGLRAEIREARKAVLASATQMNRLQAENTELINQLNAMQVMLNSKQNLNTAPRVLALEQENAKLKTTIAKLRSELSRMEIDVRRSYDAKVRKIVSTLDEHTKERNMVEKGWIRNQDKLKDGYERQIKTLSGELAGLKKKTAIAEAAAAAPKEYVHKTTERQADWELGVKALHPPPRTSSHQHAAVPALPHRGHVHGPTSPSFVTMETHLQTLHRQNREIERKLEDVYALVGQRKPQRAWEGDGDEAWSPTQSGAAHAAAGPSFGASAWE